MRDRADVLTDRVEEEILTAVQNVYSDALKNAIRQNAAVFHQLEGVDSTDPPAYCRTQQQKDDWRRREKRRILRKSQLAALIGVQLSKAGEKAAQIIQSSMEEIDRINREVEDIG